MLGTSAVIVEAAIVGSAPSELHSVCQISPTSFLVEVPLPGSTAAPVIAYMKDEWSLGSIACLQDDSQQTVVRSSRILLTGSQPSTL